MSREEVLKELNEIFVSIFDDDDIILRDNTTSEDIEYWDSLEQINIILACEKKWNLKFDIEEINKMKNIGEMVDLIFSKVK